MSAAESRAAVDRVAGKRQELGAEDFAAYAFLVLGMLAYQMPDVVTFVMDRADDQLEDVSAMTAALAGRATDRQVCLDAWPDAQPGDYNPSCCRFPKACSIEPPARATVRRVDAYTIMIDDTPIPATRGLEDRIRAMSAVEQQRLRGIFGGRRG